MGASAEIGQFLAVAWRKISIFASTLHKVLELYKMHIIANLEGYWSYNVDLRA